MNVFEQVQPLTDKIQSRLKASVKDTFPHSLREPIRYFLDTPGKKIRPLLTLLTCQAVGGEIEKALPAAAGIELFHDFTLIHDDIMDKDELRRGRPTVHQKWDEGTAILVGDAILGIAYSNILQCDTKYITYILDLFSDALIRVCEGQALDKEFEIRDQVRIEEYLDMISKKTAWLFKLSCQIGAILGGGSVAQVDKMKRFGHQIGMGFQIQDDLLDYIADELKLGKKVGSDLKMAKKTYITLKYSEHAAGNTAAAAPYPGKLWQFESLTKLKQALYDLGIVKETKSRINEYIGNALNCLEKIQPLDDSNRIYQIVRFLKSRQY